MQKIIRHAVTPSRVEVTLPFDLPFQRQQLALGRIIARLGLLQSDKKLGRG